MNEQPILNNPDVLEKLCRHFDYLNDLPSHLQGQFLEDACHLGTLETDDFLGFVLGYPEEDTALPEHFPMLSVTENSQITSYCLLKPVLPWPQPIIGVSVPPIGPGRVTGVHSVPVLLKPCGSAQLWWGGDVGVLWEAFLEGDIQERQDYEALMNQLWGHCEDFLKSRGVQLIYTESRDPEFDERWYKDFLERRGYIPVKGRRITVRKEI
ncbi:MAG: hypothetical protein HC851_20175 [Acaryochloris sp. RU_4_1]|nr:hypothetical protein [Acaryochloris sp. RU_4_1]